MTNMTDIKDLDSLIEQLKRLRAKEGNMPLLHAVRDIERGDYLESFDEDRLHIEEFHTIRTKSGATWYASESFHNPKKGFVEGRMARILVIGPQPNQVVDVTELDRSAYPATL